MSTAQEGYALPETNTVPSRPNLVVVGGTSVEDEAEAAVFPNAEEFKAVTWWPDYRQNPLDSLTPTELDVAGLIGLALNEKEVAERLKVGTQTGKFHTKHVKEKLDVDNRAQIGIVARRAGIFARAIAEAESESEDPILAVTRLAMRDVHFGEDHQVLPQWALTPQELAIFTVMSHGAMSNKDIAQIFWLTEQTVKFHSSNIYRKLELRDRSQLAFVAAFARSGIAAQPIKKA